MSRRNRQNGHYSPDLIIFARNLALFKLLEAYFFKKFCNNLIRKEDVGLKILNDNK